MKINQFNQQLLTFLAAAPTPFHAVFCMAEILRKHGFVQLNASAPWSIKENKKYFITKNNSSIIAFHSGSHLLAQHGIRMVGAHTDSPCLKVKSQPTMIKNQYLQLGVETYGGALLHSWFDRDLSIAGRITYQSKNNELKNTLLNFEQPIAVIPSLAIHLDRHANEQHSINGQTDLPPILMQVNLGKKITFDELLLDHLSNSKENIEIEKILDFDLSFYDTQAPAIIGLKQEFIASARLDNLLSCYVGLMALVNTDSPYPYLLVCNDHEEVGSQSATGAQGPLLRSFIERITQSSENYHRTIANSFMVSADNAHGVHPNFADKHDVHHAPLLNHGPAIKVNANQRYATNSLSSAIFYHLAELTHSPVQSFIMRNDMKCGSTIGPITATEIGVNTLDVGVPTFAMHSIRELAGQQDAYTLYNILLAYNAFETFTIA